MKLAFSLAVLLLFAVGSHAQPRSITAVKYEKVFQFAVSKTNDKFPFIFTVTTNLIENGKIVSTVTEVDERESMGRERIKRTTVSGGRTTNKYQLRVDFENVFCSDDGVSWKPPTPYECYSPVSSYGPEEPVSVKYTVTRRYLNGRTVKIYREYSVFALKTAGGKKTFRQTVSTIDRKGLFIKVVDTEGTLGPRAVALTRKQTWDTKTRIRPIVVPIK
jgi:hypothetical protein